MREAAAIEEIQQEELGRLFGSFATLRLLMIPLPMGVIAWCALADPAPWRRIVLLTIVAVATTISLRELLLFRKTGMRRIRFQPTLLGAGFGHLVITALTGGTESPFALAFAPLALLVAGFIPSRRARIAFTALQVAGIGTMTACAMRGWLPSFVPLPFGGGPRAGHGDTLLATHGLMASVLVVFAGMVGRRLRLGFDTLQYRASEARADALRAHAEQSQLLTAFSGEIAHELKNPLASVKGLATLMASEQQGKNSERIGVLRREVDRMQSILDEFLNFSRPLGPLAREPVDLVELCQSVLALHEGQLRAGGIAAAVDAETPVNAPCDPRKVKQVVINLVQNAIEAKGGELRIELRESNGTARVRLLDRGSGIDGAIATHAFDSGATTKPKGSGLGLTIARALARQHGGELTLANRDGGGCVAELTLPKAAP